MQTPFGTLYSTNLTPDGETGIGRWSFSAFQRAMREGISRDGRHLYPAFPYTAFARTSDDDLTAIYAYLMSQPPVRSETPAAQLKFPFSIRALMAGWNAVFHEAKAFQPDPARSEEWNRGAYLVEGLGHCGACHTPRNVLGAEKSGRAYLAGAMVDGWEAPSLTTLSQAPVPWDADSLYRYLRTGYSPLHGAAGGPMGPVVHELQELPDADIRAMAAYLSSFNASTGQPAGEVARTTVSDTATRAPLPSRGSRMFDSACGACHHDGDGPRLLGVNVPLALNTNLHSDKPDNLLRTILDGVRQPATGEIGFMPAFRDALSDAQIEELTAYMRLRFAPGKPAWRELGTDVERVRALAPDPH